MRWAGQRSGQRRVMRPVRFAYVVAASLCRGRFELAELDGSAFIDPAILAVAAPISYQIDSASSFPRHCTS
jgi:hypothetical protein